jgi:hypothetical protein
MEYFIVENPYSRNVTLEYNYPCGLVTYISYERAKKEAEDLELKNFAIAVYCSDDRNHLI